MGWPGSRLSALVPPGPRVASALASGLFLVLIRPAAWGIAHRSSIF